MNSNQFQKGGEGSERLVLKREIELHSRRQCGLEIVCKAMLQTGKGGGVGPCRNARGQNKLKYGVGELVLPGVWLLAPQHRHEQQLMLTMFPGLSAKPPVSSSCAARINLINFSCQKMLRL